MNKLRVSDVNFSPTPELLTESDQLIRAMCDAGVTEDMKVSLYDIQYQGFDPKMFNAYLLALAKENGLTQAEHMRHVRSMACVGTVRGNNLKKLVSHGTRALVVAVAVWTKVYKLTCGKPYTVTLVRVAASMSRMISTGSHRGILGLEGAVRPIDIDPGFPKGMCYNNFGMLIPTSLKTDELAILVDSFYYHQFLFDRQINASAKESTALTDIVKFADIQISSRVYTNEERLSHCKSIGLIVQDPSTRERTCHL